MYSSVSSEVASEFCCAAVAACVKIELFVVATIYIMAVGALTEQELLEWMEKEDFPHDVLQSFKGS